MANLQLAGLVKNGTTPVSCVIRAYLRSTGVLVGSTTSNAAGEFLIAATSSDEHVVVAEWDADHNALVFDHVLPVHVGTFDPYWSGVRFLLDVGQTGGLTNLSEGAEAFTSHGTVAVGSGPHAASNALLFDGSTYLRVPSGQGVSVSGDFCVEAFLKIPSYGASQIVFWKAIGTGYYQFLLFVNGSGNLVARCFSLSETLVIDIASSVQVPTQAWQHVAFARSGPDFRVFLGPAGGQSVVVASGTFSGALRAVDEPVGIGASEDGQYKLAAGSMLYQPRITTGAARYTEPFDVPTVPFPSE